ncbi:MAG: phosphopantetheine-binding protein [Paludibacteraceae bacterium]|nr:phosphopantetheine-binding protein [Paludibacteraceae bacterium]
MSELIENLKNEVIEALNLEGMSAAEIDENAPLFNGGDPTAPGLGLDSIDALELIVLMERNYGIKLKNASEGKDIFKSIATMAEYISKNRTK